MRLRYKPWAKEKIEQYPQYVVSSPEQYKGKWGTAFEKDQPLHIEIGTGKGRFVTEMARANPAINYLGLELQESVIVSALDRLIEAELQNLKILHENAVNLPKYF